MMDDSASIAELRAQRAKAEAAHKRKQRRAKARKAARKGPAAAAPAAAGPPRKQRRSRSAWAVKADAVCTETHEESLTLLERYPLTSPGSVLVFLEAAIDLSAQATARIERLGPAPNRRVHARLMRELRASLTDARRDLAELKDGWDQAAARRMTGETGRDRVIRRLFARLGSRACVEL